MGINLYLEKKERTMIKEFSCERIKDISKEAKESGMPEDCMNDRCPMQNHGTCVLMRAYGDRIVNKNTVITISTRRKQ